jgi:hypothetical protein
MNDMANVSDVLEAERPVDADTALASVTEGDKTNVVSLTIEGNKVEVDLARIPYDIRLHLLTNATRAYITNRISTAQNKAKKENTAWDTYDAAVANDPLQNYVPKPDDDRIEVDADKIVVGAINALYSGQLGKRKGERKPKEVKDPLVAAITRIVVTRLYNKRRAENEDYKYFSAAGEVGTDGLQYLRDQIEEKVEAGGNRVLLEKNLEEVYIKPAKTMLGIMVPKGMQDVDIL